ncbi:DsbC family protein [Halomonas cupida]|uniref:DsbC family protein n=1 Tax=Halomonas cupida TaxID=44933 RepID=UPI003A9527B2
MTRTLSVITALTLTTGLLASSVAMADTPEALNELEVNGQKMPVKQVLETPMEGIYEVRLDTGENFYTNAEGNHFLIGDLFENTDDGLVNLSEQRRNTERAERIAAIPVDEQIVYRGTAEPKATITVFTDTTCGYCRKFHEEVPQLNDMGIEVNYLAFPRGGMMSDGARRLEQVWCTDNRTEALTDAKQDELPESPASCDNPVAAQYQLGRELGVQGTPAIVLPDGTMVPGYVPADRLAAMLGIDG